MGESLQDLAGMRATVEAEASARSSSSSDAGWPWWYAPVGLALGGLLPLGVFSEMGRVRTTYPRGLGTLIIEALFVAIALALARTRGPLSRRAFALQPMRITPGRAGLWILLGLIAVVIVDVTYIGFVGHVGRPRLFRSAPSGAEAWLIAFAGVVTAPIGEELFFRGFFHRALRTRLSTGTAVAISATVFGFMHWWFGDPLTAVFPRIGAGVLLALLLERTGSLYPGMVCHAMFNLSVAAWALPSWGPKLFLLPPIAWFVAILVSLHDPRRKREQPPGDGPPPGSSYAMHRPDPLASMPSGWRMRSS